MADANLIDAGGPQTRRPRRPDGPLVLVIEDSVGMGQYIETILKSIGCEVVRAENGAAGLEKVHALAPALILLDLQMPEMDGITVLKRLRGRQPYDAIPVIVLTARQSIEDVTTACALGAKDFMTKPFDPMSLIAKVTKHVSVRRPA